MEQKSFQELNLSNAFLFSAAMEDPQICRLALECILGQDIGKVEVRTEYNVLYNSDFKYIRLDVFGKDELEVSYDLEMQRQEEKNLPKRSRYYQAELDMASLKPGEDYNKLKPLYVIFICNFDPFEEKLYCYTFEMLCVEKGFPLNDGVKRIFLNIQGENKEDVSESLIEFLGYLNNSTDAYVENIRDDRVRKIHENVEALKRNRNLGARYMYLEEYLESEINQRLSERVEKEVSQRVEKEVSERVEKEVSQRVEKEVSQRVEKEVSQRVEKEVSERVEKEVNEKVARSLIAMVEMLCDYLPDVETIYQKVSSKEIYSQVTREEVEEIYSQIIKKSNTVQ